MTAKKGRVMVIQPDKDMAVSTLFQSMGPVHDLKAIHGFLAVAAASRVSDGSWAG